MALPKCSVTFEQSTGLTTLHVQPFHDGWLLCESRGGRAAAYNRAGRLERILDLGDASKDVQTTSDGKIWVSYFDEGVYGGGIGQHGVVCFDSRTGAIFKYSDFAEQHELPLIDDCYAMNVVGDDEVWLFLLFRFSFGIDKNIQTPSGLERIRLYTKRVAIFERAVVFPKCYTRIHGANPNFKDARYRTYPKPRRSKLSMTARKQLKAISTQRGEVPTFLFVDGDCAVPNDGGLMGLSLSAC